MIRDLAVECHLINSDVIYRSTYREGTYEVLQKAIVAVLMLVSSQSDKYAGAILGLQADIHHTCP